MPKVGLARQLEFVERVQPAIQLLKRRFPFLSEVGLMAFIAYNTNYGRHPLVTSANNPMFVMADASWEGDVFKMVTSVNVGDEQWRHTILHFKKYANLENALEDFLTVLMRKEETVVKLSSCSAGGASDVEKWIELFIGMYDSHTRRYVKHVQRCASIIRANLGDQHESS